MACHLKMRRTGWTTLNINTIHSTNVYTDCGWLCLVVDTFAPPGLRNIRSLATFGYFKKNTLRKIRLDLCCVFCMLCLSLVSGYLMMFCSGRWWPRLPKILMFCAKILSCHLMIRITLIFAHKLLCKHDCHIWDRKKLRKGYGIL